MCRMVSGIAPRVLLQCIKRDYAPPPPGRSNPHSEVAVRGLLVWMCVASSKLIEGTALLSRPQFHPSPSVPRGVWENSALPLCAQFAAFDNNKPELYTYRYHRPVELTLMHTMYQRVPGVPYIIITYKFNHYIMIRDTEQMCYADSIEHVDSSLDTKIFRTRI